MNWIDVLIYIGFAVALGVGTWLAWKYKITAEEVRTLLNVVTLMKFVNKQVDYRLQDDLERIMGYISSWVNYLIPYRKKNEYTYKELYEAFMVDASSFCAKEGIIVDEELNDILDLVADLVIKYWLGAKENVS